MKKGLIKNLISIIVFGILFLGIGDLLAYLISQKYEYNLRDVMFLVGLGIIIIGILSMIGGNSTGLNLQGLGQANSQYIANANLEVTRMEREATNYHNSAKNRISIKAAFGSLSIILGGLFMILNSFIIG